MVEIEGRHMRLCSPKCARREFLLRLERLYQPMVSGQMLQTSGNMSQRGKVVAPRFVLTGLPRLRTRGAVLGR